MKQEEINAIKEKIDEATIVSFDVFDTLLFRKVNSPEVIFELVGKHFGIHGFRRVRIEGQDEANRRAYDKSQCTHADINEIYDVLSENEEIQVDWNEVKEFELRIEEDSLTVNSEMLEIFNYAKSTGKKVIATSDTYLLTDTLQNVLEKNGYSGVCHVYRSVNEYKTELNHKNESFPYGEILHIGNDKSADVKTLTQCGIKTHTYEKDANMEKIKDAPDAGIDKSLYKILFQREHGFWYNLGVEVGGPLYMGTYIWLEPKVKDNRKTFYFLSCGGYNLYQLFKKAGYKNVEYLYTSKRSLILAGITEMNEEDIKLLPPYTTGQTVAEILEYLCVSKDDIVHLDEVGFQSYWDIIRTEQQMNAFKKLYTLNRGVFLARCELERKNAIRYFSETGFLSEDSVIFDCDWNGSSQYLLERFKNAVKCSTKTMFYYFGIRNTPQSRQQLRGCHYDTYLFDFYKNHALQAGVDEATAIYEIFFSAPHESVHHYDETGVVFEKGGEDGKKAEMLHGIMDYLSLGLPFARKYDVEYSNEMSVGHLQRLIMYPDSQEAMRIGNLKIPNEFTKNRKGGRRIAYITEQQLKNNPASEVYWMRGVLKRNDISEKVKNMLATRHNIPYPEPNEKEYHLEDEQSIRNYYRWLRYQQKHLEMKVELSYQPMFSVVIPVYNTVTEQLKECIDSVLAQNYNNFELILVDDHSSWKNVVPLLKKYEDNEKVTVIYRTENGHISISSNDGINAAHGEFIAFMDCDDTIEPNALYEVAKKLNEDPLLDFIYSDEDKITEDGKIRHAPFFKPDWSPDLFMCLNYTNHLSVYRTTIINKIGGFRSAYNGSQDYDFVLRFMERSSNKRVGHIPKILYHWRERKESVAFTMSSKNYAIQSARYAKEDWIRRNNINARLEYIYDKHQYRLIYEITGNPLVSIIIPSKDNPDILRQCIDSIYEFTSYKNFEIIVVDNGSNDINKAKVSTYLSSKNISYIYEKETFNFSKMCNKGANCASGEYLLFLNDDTEVISPEWMERMLGHAQLPHIGAVGAKLFYSETTRIQHSGVGNIKEGPSHNFCGHDDSYGCYFGLNWVEYNCIAVTGACLMVSSDKFWEVNGFDEGLPVAYNDVALCFSLHEAGYYNVIRNDAILYHHESFSRGYDYLDDAKMMRLSSELEKLYLSFPALNRKDPFLNKNLHLYSDILNTSVEFDELETCDINEAKEQKFGYVDSIEITDRIRIIGWSYIEGVENAERYLVFSDPYGNSYKSMTHTIIRQDVEDYYKDKKYRYTGFECILDKKILRTDIIPYKVGIMACDKEETVISWSDKVPNIIRNPKARSFMCSYKRIVQYEKHNNDKNINWCVDSIDNKGDYYEIRGFAFLTENAHYRYRKSIFLADSQCGGFEFDVLDEERIDVTAAFPEYHFLYYTGFRCLILKDILEADKEYDVIIRLRNQFDSGDIIDVLTHKKLRINMS